MEKITLKQSFLLIGLLYCSINLSTLGNSTRLCPAGEVPQHFISVQHNAEMNPQSVDEVNAHFLCVSPVTASTFGQGDITASATASSTPSGMISDGSSSLTCPTSNQFQSSIQFTTATPTGHNSYRVTGPVINVLNASWLPDVEQVPGTSPLTALTNARNALSTLAGAGSSQYNYCAYAMNDKNNLVLFLWNCSIDASNCTF